jgi:hypothetical protein
MPTFFDALGIIAGRLRDGFIAGLATHNGHQAPPNDRIIRRLIHEIGWQIDEENAGALGLHFHDAQGRLKKVFIVAGDPTVLVASHSDARIPIADLPAELFAWLAKRNGEILWGAWHAYSAAADRIAFMVAYSALTQGLTPPIFQNLAESLAVEAAHFDRRLEKAGLLP